MRYIAAQPHCTECPTAPSGSTPALAEGHGPTGAKPRQELNSAGLVPAVVFPSALAFFAAGEFIGQRRNAELDSQTCQKSRFVGAQEHHGTRFVIVDSRRSQIEDPSCFFGGTAEADEANDFALPGGEVVFCHGASFLDKGLVDEGKVSG